jgi:malonate transporter and related proteins
VSGAVLIKLLAIMASIALGWLAARQGWLGRLNSEGQGGADPIKVLSATAFNLFVPALLFRTMVRQDLAALPWRMLAAFFVPALAFTVAVYLWRRRQGGQGAAPATRAVAAAYGNAVQLGIPLSAALFGEVGLALHISLVSLHGVLMLTLLTALAEADLARDSSRADSGRAVSRSATLRTTVRNTVIHPVVLPVLAGLLYNLTGLGLHPVVDQTLQGLGSAVVPLCLVLIGASLAAYGLRRGLAGAVEVLVLKLLVMPAVVLVVAHWGFGLSGTALSVLVMMAALPVGSNALLFAQRYQTLEGEATVAIVASTVAFIATAALWLSVLAWIH